MVTQEFGRIRELAWAHTAADEFEHPTPRRGWPGWGLRRLLALGDLIAIALTAALTLVGAERGAESWLARRLRARMCVAGFGAHPIAWRRNGASSLPMHKAGGGSDVEDVTLTLDDEAAGSIPIPIGGWARRRAPRSRPSVKP